MDKILSWFGDIFTSRTFADAAQHFTFGGFFVLAACVLWGHPVACASIFAGWAAQKEFWFDAKFENPPEPWQRALPAFGYYVLGALAAVAVWALR